MFIYYIDEKFKFLMNLRVILTNDFEINNTFFKYKMGTKMNLLFNYF